MRDSKIDSIKGILIILVVLAHFQGDKFHDIVFLFHMPLFFMISGYLFKQETSFDRNYIRKVFSRYLLPYFAYSISILVILDRDFSLRHLMNMAYGGRALDGTYWYITCLVFSLCLFAIIKNRFYPRTTILIILAGGGHSDSRIDACKENRFS